MKIQKLQSVLLCLQAHPDNEKDSEFADRIDDLEKIIAEIEAEEKYITDLLRKIEVQTDALVKVRKHPDTTEEKEIEKLDAVIRFLKSFYNDVEALKELPKQKKIGKT